jgi:O-methyltransferase involved in polyketide biosynthesis
VAWDFEHDPLERLPDHLCNLGYRRDARGCVVWEGVTMYLSEAANAATFAMLADTCSPPARSSPSPTSPGSFSPRQAGATA